jgi:hypothetical protein
MSSSFQESMLTGTPQPGEVSKAARELDFPTHYRFGEQQLWQMARAEEDVAYVARLHGQALPMVLPEEQASGISDIAYIAPPLDTPLSPEDSTVGEGLPEVPKVSYSVKNTFVTFESERNRREEEFEEHQIPPLGDALEIIPEDVSAERLAEYRHNYQRFRAGHSVGAKGEVNATYGIQRSVEV